MTDKVQKIREEVERIQLYTQSEVLKQILDYIDKVQKEPVAPKVLEDMLNAKTAAESLGISQEEHDRIVDKLIYGKEPELVDVDDLPNKEEEPVSEDLEDEIRKYFLSYKGYPHIMDETEREIKKAIIYFANWQNQQMIDKACNFIYEQLNNGIMECGDIETFINDFKKAMEE